MYLDHTLVFLSAPLREIKKCGYLPENSCKRLEMENAATSQLQGKSAF